jgi:hypothetical protein
MSVCESCGSHDVEVTREGGCDVLRCNDCEWISRPSDGAASIGSQEVAYPWQTNTSDAEFEEEWEDDSEAGE